MSCCTRAVSSISCPAVKAVNSLGPQRLLQLIADVFADIENGAGRAVYFPTSTRTRRKSDEKLLRCRHLPNNRQEKRIKRHAIRDLGIGLL